MRKFLFLLSFIFVLSACAQGNPNHSDSLEELGSEESNIENNTSTEPLKDISLDPLKFRLLKEYTGGALILRRNNEGLGAGKIMDLIEVNLIGEEKQLGILKLAGAGKVVFNEETKTLYFLAFDDPNRFEKTDIYEFNFDTREVKKIPIESSGASEENPEENKVIDFVLGENKIFYLKGTCSENSDACQLLSYDPLTQENKLLLENLKAGPVSGFTLDRYDFDQNKLILSLAGGDAGMVSRNAYEIDLNNPVLPEPKSYSYFSTCDEELMPETAADCSEEVVTNNQAFLTMREDFATQLCPNETVRNKFKDDWSVMFVYCPQDSN